MLRKALVSSTIALLVVLVWVLGVMAQGPTTSDVAAEEEEASAVTVLPNLAAASVAQRVPVTLTLNIPGPTGTLTVEVPVVLNLDIRIGISPELTATIDVTGDVTSEVGTDVVAGDEATVEATATATDDDTDDDDAAAATSTPTPTPAADAPEPTAPPLPTPTPEPTAAEPVVEAPLCPDPRAVIVAPGVGQVLRGDVNLLGTATHEDFQYYKVEYAPGADVNPDSSFIYLADARTPVTGGVLATFDSTLLDNGDYTLKLTVVDRVGNFPPPCTVSVVIAN